MKRFVIGFVIVAVLAVALGTAGYVYAQTPVPGSGSGAGAGMMGGRRGMMGNQAAGTQTGPLHDEMIAVFAQKLGLTVDELNTRLAKGETMAQIASSKGLTADQFTTLMTEVRTQAIDQAVTNGELTQAQADWMKQRGAGMMGSGRGMRGAGQGLNANPDCPYSQTNP
jgi:hypothetical protein